MNHKAVTAEKTEFCARQKTLLMESGTKTKRKTDTRG
jgi:hypothetical protein